MVASDKNNFRITSSNNAYNHVSQNASFFAQMHITRHEEEACVMSRIPGVQDDSKNNGRDGNKEEVRMMQTL